MLGFLAAAVAGWIGLFIVLAAAPRAGRSTAPSPPRAPRTPRAPRLPRPPTPSGPPRAPSPPSSSRSTATDQASPAVVSLLAGRLDKDGYAVTLLDLAARGWLLLNAPANGPVMCAIIPGGLRAMRGIQRVDVPGRHDPYTTALARRREAPQLDAVRRPDRGQVPVAAAA